MFFGFCFFGYRDNWGCWLVRYTARRNKVMVWRFFLAKKRTFATTTLSRSPEKKHSIYVKALLNSFVIRGFCVPFFASFCSLSKRVMNFAPFEFIGTEIALASNGWVLFMSSFFGLDPINFVAFLFKIGISRRIICATTIFWLFSATHVIRIWKSWKYHMRLSTWHIERI